MDELFTGLIESVGRASWTGSIAVVVGFAICRMFPRIPPHVRCWLWRLVYLKFAVALVWTNPIDLHLLPPASPSVSPDGTMRFLATWFDSMISLPTKLPWISALWLSGLVILLGRAASERILANRLLAACHEVHTGPALSCYTSLCEHLGLHQKRGLPGLMECEHVTGPLIIGIRRPMIILPSCSDQARSRGQLELLLAHEVAHWLRRDLLWSVLPALVHPLLFFNPLVWLANREWKLAQEMACDEFALRITNAPPDVYAQMLVSVATGRTSALPLAGVALGGDPWVTAMKRRLHAMEHFWWPSFPQRAAFCAAVTVLSIIGIPPWKLVPKDASSQQDAIVDRFFKTEVALNAAQDTNLHRIAKRSAKRSATRTARVRVSVSSRHSPYAAPRWKSVNRSHIRFIAKAQGLAQDALWHDEFPPPPLCGVLVEPTRAEIVLKSMDDDPNSSRDIPAGVTKTSCSFGRTVLYPYEQKSAETSWFAYGDRQSRITMAAYDSDMKKAFQAAKTSVPPQIVTVVSPLLNAPGPGVAAQ